MEGTCIRNFIKIKKKCLSRWYYVVNKRKIGCGLYIKCKMGLIYVSFLYIKKIFTVSSFERVEQFKYLGTALTNQNSIQEEIKSGLKSGNPFYHSV